MTDMWHKDKYMHIYMRLLKYDLLVVVTCQKHVQKKFIPIKHNIMWSQEICVEISMVCPSFIWYAYIYGEFVLFHVFLAYDSALTLDDRYIKIWINEEQNIKLGLLAIFLFWDTKYRDFKIILGFGRSKNFPRDPMQVGTVGSTVKTSGRSSILGMLRAKRFNRVNV